MSATSSGIWRLGRTSLLASSKPAPGRLVDWRKVASAERACCCPARPMVVALLPAWKGRPYEADLLFCAHHFRRHVRALAVAGARFMSTDGVPLQPWRDA
jgi:hypothetical protein